MQKDESVQVKLGRILVHFFVFTSLWASVVILGEYYLSITYPLTMSKKVFVTGLEIGFPIVHITLYAVGFVAGRFMTRFPGLKVSDEH